MISYFIQFVVEVLDHDKKNAKTHLLANEMIFDLDKFKIFTNSWKRIALQCGSSGTKETKNIISNTEREREISRSDFASAK